LLGDDVGVHGDLLDGHDFGGDVGPFSVEHDDHVLPGAEFVGDVVAGVLGGGEGLARPPGQRTAVAMLEGPN